jgi:DNA polymerase-1
LELIVSVQVEDLAEFQGDYRAITTMDGLKRFLDTQWAAVHAGHPLGFDVETGYTGPAKRKASLDVDNPNQFVVGFSLTDSLTMARYVPLRHDFADNLDPETVWTEVKPLLEAATLVAHNWVFEARNLRALERKGHGPAIHLDWRHAQDTMIQSYVLSETRLHGLKSLTQERYGYEQAHIETLFPDKMTAEAQACLRFNVLDVNPAVVNYVCDDVCWALRLDRDLRQRCEDERDMVYKLERQILGILVDMTETGVAVDWDGISTDAARFDFFYQQMENRTRRLFEEAAGRDLTTLNFRSPTQMRQLLFEDLGLHSTRTTKADKNGETRLSTDETALEALRHQHPAVDQLLKYRQCKKMGEWLDLWSGLRTSHDERVHPTLNQVRVQSGRFASDAPNVQNISKHFWFTVVDRDPEQFPPGKDGDAAFTDHVRATGTNGIDYWEGSPRDYLVASPGYTLLSFDYKAAEMRVLAGLAAEPYLIAAFREGRDPHITAASLAFKVPFDQVTPTQRQGAKAVNFGLIFGQGAQGLADGLGISKDEAQKIIDAYFAAFTQVDRWFAETKSAAYRNGYVTSWLGRKSTLWDLQSESRAVQSKAERMMINIPVQGGAADYCKLAMVQSRRVLTEHGWWADKVRLLMNQHDSLVFEVHSSLYLREVRDILQPAVSFPLGSFFPALPPMDVDWELGQRWGSVKKFDDEPEAAEPQPDHEPQPDPPAPDILVLHFADRPTRDVIIGVKAILVRHPGSVPVLIALNGREAAVPGVSVTYDDQVAEELAAAYACQIEARQIASAVSST